SLIHTVIIELIFIVVIGQLLKVELVPKDGANTTETLHKLVALAGSIRNEFEGGAEVPIFLCQPLQERLAVDNLHLLTGVLVHELGAISLVSLGGVDDDLLSS